MLLLLLGFNSNNCLASIFSFSKLLLRYSNLSLLLYCPYCAWAMDWCQGKSIDFGGYLFTVHEIRTYDVCISWWICNVSRRLSLIPVAAIGLPKQPANILQVSQISFWDLPSSSKPCDPSWGTSITIAGLHLSIEWDFLGSIVCVGWPVLRKLHNRPSFEVCELLQRAYTIFTSYSCYWVIVTNYTCSHCKYLINSCNFELQYC